MRLVVIGVVFLLCVAAGATAGYVVLRDEAVALGIRFDGYDLRLENAIRRERTDGPLLVWLGDSTLVRAGRGGRSAPELLGDALGGTLESRVVAALGLDSFHHYCLMGPILDLQPELVVMVANLSMFDPDRRSRRDNSIARFIPTSELGRAVRLPLYERGLTVPRLLLMRTLRYDAINNLRYFGSGVRRMFRRGLNASLRPRPAAGARTAALREAYLALAPLAGAQAASSFDYELHRSDAPLRMLGAATSMARRRGVTVLVYASPIPHRRHPELGWYDAEEFGRRIGAIGDVVEDGGGEFIDLHAALPDDAFVDVLGHLTADGAKRFAAILGPVVERAMSQPVTGRKSPGDGPSTSPAGRPL